MTDSADTYFDPDDVGPHDSPRLKPVHINIRPSPPPEIHLTPLISPGSGPGGRKGAKRSDNWPCQGVAVLIRHMSGGNHPDIEQKAGIEALPSDEDEDEESPVRGTAVEVPGHNFSHGPADLDIKKMAADAVDILDRKYPEYLNESVGSTGEAVAACKVLANANANAQARNSTAAIKYLPRSLDPYPRAKVEVNIKVETQSAPATGELPPMRHSPQSGASNGNGSQQITLPSLSEQLGSFGNFAESITTPNDTSYSHSPGRTISRFTPGPRATSPGKSPNDPRGDMVSPGIPPYQFMTNSLRRASQSNGPQHVASGEYSSSSNTETPSTDQSGSTPAAAAIDRMSIDGITNPQVGGYQCNYAGCTAAPFQTQYLLNSHANVHSSNRPHYCTVKGCPRAEGGKGFKRKNEMIRHGLVHDSPGYVCPFCPEREHRYPRPDNLQRHVRVHHTDKDKDDPQLREVLAQRPEGPSRGRRRRGGSR
ncbi:4b696830-9bea-4429-8200-4912e90c36b1 [Sclerotinia trifoliorum]|uniref:4b696830-9bea-4429-8200-4912e90c36b1 n=1 Tax=Sclerotinia trifoliorum TaxID=28548 RepID=A0A8H2VRG7_9HELO|nr:4b696830-9bea-4429-8200-4912e90c36b1 [Sclerotinia trifoliorum]